MMILTFSQLFRMFLVLYGLRLECFPLGVFVYLFVVSAGSGKKYLKYTEYPTLVTLGLRLPDLANKK